MTGVLFYPTNPLVSNIENQQNRVWVWLREGPVTALKSDPSSSIASARYGHHGSAKKAKSSTSKKLAATQDENQSGNLPESSSEPAVKLSINGEVCHLACAYVAKQLVRLVWVTCACTGHRWSLWGCYANNSLTYFWNSGLVSILKSSIWRVRVHTDCYRSSSN